MSEALAVIDGRIAELRRRNQQCMDAVKQAQVMLVRVGGGLEALVRVRQQLAEAEQDEDSGAEDPAPDTPDIDEDDDGSK